MINTCHICNRSEWHDVSGASFQVQQCDKCDEEVCQDHADSDYDAVGDPLRYICTEWVCKDNQCNAVAAINSTFQGDDMNNERQTALADAHKVIDWFEAHPNVPLPMELNGGHLTLTALNTKEECALLAKEFGTCDKQISDSLFYLIKHIGCHTIKALFIRDSVCERIVIATEEVPETIIPEVVKPAHIKEIVEWRCASLLATTEEAETVAA